MKKIQQILSILGLLFATMTLLVVIFVKYYENDGMTVLDYVEQIRNEIVADAGQNENNRDNRDNEDKENKQNNEDTKDTEIKIETESAENVSGDTSSTEQHPDNTQPPGQQVGSVPSTEQQPGDAQSPGQQVGSEPSTEQQPGDAQSTEQSSGDTQSAEQQPNDTQSTNQTLDNTPSTELQPDNTQSADQTPDNTPSTEVQPDNTQSTEQTPGDTTSTEAPSVELPSTEVENPAYVEFVPADSSYFEDALFIGDSRCVGIAEYGTIDNATFFVLEGMAIRNVWKKTIDVKGIGETTLQNLLETKSFGKIYVMLGINEVGYELDDTIVKYKGLLDKLHALVPDAIIYVCSNLHVTAKLSAKGDACNNDMINAMNARMQALTDNEVLYYLEVNEKFNDADGNLIATCTSDQVHLYAKYYAEWSQWFYEKTIPITNIE